MDGIAELATGIRFPQTPAATAALSVASRFYTPPLLNHCVRSYLWGATYASVHGITFDEELLYVSAMLHDIGLTDVFDSHTSAFRGGGRGPGLGLRGGGRLASRSCGQGDGDHRAAHARRRLCDR